MQRVVLGRTKLEVSVMGLGAGGDSRLGTKLGDDQRSLRLVQTALEHGVNFIDTAEAYGTEDVVGRGIAGWPRDRLVLSTKKTTFNTAAVEPADVVRSLEQSLQRLRTDYVDIYHLHGVRPDSYVDLRERLLPTLLRLREQGKLRFLGITEAFGADPTHRTLQLALKDDVFDVMMVGFNILNQSARSSVFPLTQAQDVGTLIMFAVRRALSRPDRLRELLQDLAARGKIERSLAERGLDFLTGIDGVQTLPEAAYRFCRAEPGAHVILSGTSDEAHLLENVRALEKPALSPETQAELIQLFRHVDDVSGH